MMESSSEPSRLADSLTYQAAALARISAIAPPIGWSLERVYELFPRLEERKKQDGVTLSGGEQQMLAIARALCRDIKVLLLDEPLSALDLKLRQAMRDELRALQKATGITFVFVTHDQGEALSMARNPTMNSGRCSTLVLRSA